MAIYNVTTGGINPSVFDCDTKETTCLGLDVAATMHPDGYLLDASFGTFEDRLLAHHGKELKDIAVDDGFDFFVPTYSIIKTIGIHIDQDTTGLRFDVLDVHGNTVAGRALDGLYERVVFAEPQGQPCTKTSELLAGMNAPTGLGGSVGHHHYHYSRLDAPLFYSLTGGIRIVIRQLPQNWDAARNIRFFVGGDRYAVCHNLKHCNPA